MRGTQREIQSDREAKARIKRRVLRMAAAVLSNYRDAWLYEGVVTSGEVADIDKSFEELIDELKRRGKDP